MKTLFTIETMSSKMPINDHPQVGDYYQHESGSVYRLQTSPLSAFYYLGNMAMDTHYTVPSRDITNVFGGNRDFFTKISEVKLVITL